MEDFRVRLDISDISDLHSTELAASRADGAQFTATESRAETIKQEVL